MLFCYNLHKRLHRFYKCKTHKRLKRFNKHINTRGYIGSIGTKHTRKYKGVEQLWKKKQRN